MANIFKVNPRVTKADFDLLLEKYSKFLGKGTFGATYRTSFAVKYIRLNGKSQEEDIKREIENLKYINEYFSGIKKSINVVFER